MCKTTCGRESISFARDAFIHTLFSDSRMSQGCPGCYWRAHPVRQCKSSEASSRSSTRPARYLCSFPCRYTSEACALRLLCQMQQSTRARACWCSTDGVQSLFTRAHSATCRKTAGIPRITLMQCSYVAFLESKQFWLYSIQMVLDGSSSDVEVYMIFLRQSAFRDTY